MYFEDQEGDDDREGTVTERFQSRRIAKLQLISLFRRANRISDIDLPFDAGVATFP
jgi:hypothetical protein